MKIVFAKLRAFGRETKQAWALKQKFPEIELTLFCNSVVHSHDFVNSIFDNVILFNKLEEVPKMIADLHPTLWHTCADDSNEIPYLVASIAAEPYVYDLNDPHLLYNGKVDKQEKYALENAKGIVSKFPITMWDLYRESGYNVTAPVIEYFDYCIEPFFRWNDHPKMKHLVYTGITTPLKAGLVGGNNQHIRWLPKVLAQGYQYHLYSFQASLCPEYNELPIEVKNGVNQPELQGVMSQYQYGMMIHNWIGTGRTPYFEKTSFSNKTANYLESGLPIILSSNMAWNMEVLHDRYGICIPIDLDKIDHLREIEEATDYNELRKNVQEVRVGEYNAVNNVSRLEQFYRGVI